MFDSFVRNSDGCKRVSVTKQLMDPIDVHSIFFLLHTMKVNGVPTVWLPIFFKIFSLVFKWKLFYFIVLNMDIFFALHRFRRPLLIPGAVWSSFMMDGCIFMDLKTNTA